MLLGQHVTAHTAHHSIKHGQQTSTCTVLIFHLGFRVGESPALKRGLVSHVHFFPCPVQRAVGHTIGYSGGARRHAQHREAGSVNTANCREKKKRERLLMFQRATIKHQCAKASSLDGERGCRLLGLEWCIGGRDAPSKVVQSAPLGFWVNGIYCLEIQPALQCIKSMGDADDTSKIHALPFFAFTLLALFKVRAASTPPPHVQTQDHLSPPPQCYCTLRVKMACSDGSWSASSAAGFRRPKGVA